MSASLLTDNCKKLGLVFDNVVGIVEIINSRDIQLRLDVNVCAEVYWSVSDLYSGLLM